MTTSSFENTTTHTTGYDLVVFCHLRWDFVFQRPQHLLTRFSNGHRVFLIEEPFFDADGTPRLELHPRSERITIAVPHLVAGTNPDDVMPGLVRRMFDEQGIGEYVAWFYTPMMLPWSSELSEPSAVVYDCMDELSAFRGAPPELLDREKQLFEKADLVFTGGRSLYEAKRERHDAVYCFPSSIDAAHFAQALSIDREPDDQRSIPHPRIGFAGVIDERADIELLAAIADARPDWHYVMIGPVVKIDPADLPRRDNIHYLGGKDYKELPAYIGGWDVAMMPFAMNESTRFISPTKTPEYLAAGRPVVSTPVRDVVRPYGEERLVEIASTPDEFVAAIERSLSLDLDEHRARAAEFLSTNSWDKTQREMEDLIDEVARRQAKEMAAVPA
ncbi:MAG: glycosyltransferase family 1 protein [Pyrinomonadaceae bacterium]